MKRSAVDPLVALAAIALLNASPPTFAVEPRLEWAFETRGKIYASPIITDVDGDGVPEIIVCASHDKRVICLNGRGELRWDFHMHDRGDDGIQATPSAVDCDGDGKQEIFFVDTGGVVGCLDHRGGLVWRSFTGDRADYSGPVVADVDGDGHVEVILGTDSGTLYCLDDCGMEKWHYQGDGQIRGIPAVACHPPSGTLRIYATFGGGVAACFDSTGRRVWSHDAPSTRKERRSGPAVGDLDGDGAPEVVVATDGFCVVARDAFSGQEKWRWKGQHGIDQTHSFALADFDGAGRLDVVCGDGRGLGGPGNVYRLRDGKAVWTADVGGGVVQGPAIGDVDGDGDLEILVCSRSKRLICLSSAGKQEWSFPSKAGSLTTPALGDVDGDGKVEIVFASKDRCVYCVTVDGRCDPKRLAWAMMNHDPQLSGNVSGASFKTTAPTPPEPRPTALEIDRFGPLRSGSNTIVFRLANVSRRPRHLEAVAEIARPDGSKITHVVSNRREPFESKTVAFAASTLGNGRYALTARLVDVGTGRTLAEAAAQDDFDALRAERTALAGPLRELAALRKGAVHPDSIRRATPELTQTDRRLEKLLSDAEKAYTQDVPLAKRLALVTQIQRHVGILQANVARLRAAALDPKNANQFAVVPDTSMRKVFRDEPYLVRNAPSRSARISIARNEREAFQLVVVPLWTDLKNLRVGASDLTQTGGPGRIPAADVAVHRVGYVTIGPSEYIWYVEKQGDYPDILWPASPVDVPARQGAQPFFVTVRARQDTPAGDYAGVIRVQADNGTPVETPLNVHVWDFALPAKPHLKVSLWMNESWLRAFYRYEGRTPEPVRRRFYDFHLEHRASPIMRFPLGGGELLEDLDYAIQKGQNCFFIHVPDLEKQKREPYAKQLRDARALIAKKGWDDLALLYTHDEVAVMAREAIPKVVEMSTWVHKVMPDWPRLQTSAPEQSLLGVADIWCPTINSFDPVILAERMKQGERLWFYTVWGRPGIMIEFPATDHRLMFWACWKYGAEGFLYWGTTHWDLNCAGEKRWPEVPWIPYNRQPGHNGCGYLIYPGPDGTPIGSIRLALLRDGIEDYEYLSLLRKSLKAAGDAVPKPLRRRIEAELAVDARVLVNHETFTEDPEAILAARTRIAGLIEELRALGR